MSRIYTQCPAFHSTAQYITFLSVYLQLIMAQNATSLPLQKWLLPKEPGIKCRPHSQVLAIFGVYNIVSVLVSYFLATHFFFSQFQRIRSKVGDYVQNTWQPAHATRRFFQELPLRLSYLNQIQPKLSTHFSLSLPLLPAQSSSRYLRPSLPASPFIFATANRSIFGT